MRHEVNSTSIVAIEEKGNGTIIVEFNSRGKYQYSNVPEDVIREFLRAPSVGRFFNEEIRGNYQEKKL